jgi:NTE family protein
MKIGLILIGGHIKGLAGHSGVVAALNKLDMVPSVILGASAGSVVGSFAAVGMSEPEMKHRLATLKVNDFLDPYSRLALLWEFIFNKAKNFTGFMRGEKVEKYMQECLRNSDDFSKVTIPLYIAATNLKTHEVSLFNTGRISEKVRASTAIPMLFCPKKVDDEYYIDGALSKESLPKALIEVCPDLDLIIVSNFSYEYQTADNSYLDMQTLPIFEIVRNVLAVHERRSWPNRVGQARVIYLKPGIRVSVNIFDPKPELLHRVFEETKNYTIYHIERALKIIKKARKVNEKKSEG